MWQHVKESHQTCTTPNTLGTDVLASECESCNASPAYLRHSLTEIPDTSDQQLLLASATLDDLAQSLTNLETSLFNCIRFGPASQN